MFLLFTSPACGGIDCFPTVVGNGATDTNFATITTTDTTYYPTVANADSLIILYRNPNNSTVDSLGENGTGVFNTTLGMYEVHYSTNGKAVGVYRITVKAWRGGALRGIGTTSFMVTGAGTFYYTVVDSARDQVIANADSASKIKWATTTALDDSLGNVKHIASQITFTEGYMNAYMNGITDGLITAGSICNSAFIANKFSASFYDALADTIRGRMYTDSVIIASLVAFKDSVLNAITATNKANFMRWTVAQRDSVLNAILDANKVNFMRWTTAQRDSVLNAILDANKVNFMRWTSAQRDSVLNAILDANKGNFGRWTIAQRDSLLNTILDANKVNFGRWTLAQRDSALTAILDVNKVNFGRWTIAQRDSILNAIADANKTNFKADVSGLSTFDPATDSVLIMRSLGVYALNLPDSFTIDISNAWLLRVGLSTFDPSLDSVLAKKSIGVYALNLPDSTIIDLSHAWILRNGLSTFNASSDSVLAKKSIGVYTLNLPDSTIIDLSHAWALRNGLSIFNPVTDSVLVYRSVIWGIGVTAEMDTVPILIMLNNNNFAQTGDAMTLTPAERGHIEDSVYANRADYGSGGGADTSSNKKMIQNNWDSDADGKLTTEDITCTGSGSNTVLLWVKDYSDSTGIAGFRVEIVDSITGAKTPYGAHTNSAGLCTLALDNGHYTFYLSAPRYLRTSPIYRTISANTTLTYYATAMTVSPPPADSVCIVYGYVYNKDATPHPNAKVEIGMNRSSVSFHGVLVDVSPTIVYTDSAGCFEFSGGVYPNDVLLPAGTLWYIKVTTSNLILYHLYEVPITPSWEVDFTLP